MVNYLCEGGDDWLEEAFDSNVVEVNLSSGIEILAGRALFACDIFVSGKSKIMVTYIYMNKINKDVSY